MKNFTVLDLLDLELKEKDELKLQCVSGRRGLTRTIPVPNINRPGLALNNFFDNFAYERVQIIGRGEQAFIEMLERENRIDSLKQLFEFKIPCCIVTSGMEPNIHFLQLADESGIAILKTPFNSSEFVLRIMRVLGDVFAPRQIIHATLVEVFGLGILIKGESGVGKSEAALELLERGHRLIADDAVELRSVTGDLLVGQGANEVTGHHMEIRGLGIININHLFGVRAIRDKKQIQLIVNLEEWDSSKTYDRFGGQDVTEEFLGIHVSALEIPVKPGRNIPIIIETAAMNERLKKMGHFSAQEFNENVLDWLESENAKNVYYQDTDTF